MPRVLPYVALLLAAPAIALAQAAPAATEDIGGWRLACAVDRMTDRAACLLRLQEWVERPAGGAGGLALEIIDRQGRLVPAVTARDLTLDSATRGLLALTGTAQLRFPPNRLFEMPCGLDGRSIVCAPRAEDAARAEAELLAAYRALVRVVGTGAGPTTAEPAELRLAGTREAVARFARQAPPQPSTGGEALGVEPRELMQRLLRLFGN
ncbi:hypothetical protein QWZ14_17590 [Paeniroseomonas aquatica]|uniref:Invasion associated locus B family protein n=1 Tax=Paeniroseomonas aquatica TaxID=373043 RepID=A0ABT8A905_9PROT|nr:hypothetical protein [Paeniroseomonas aquatica]MDN3566185.1 hypothetical protein [Paeniroseomonas aquatica]